MIKTIDITKVERTQHLSGSARWLYYILLGEADSNSVAPVNLEAWAMYFADDKEVRDAWEELNRRELVKHNGYYLLIHGYHKLRSGRKPVAKFPIPRELIEEDQGFTVLRDVDFQTPGRKYALDAPVTEIIGEYNRILGDAPTTKNPRCSVASDSLKRHINRRWLENKDYQDVEFWSGLFQHIRSRCPWLVGASGPWSADLGWIVMPDNLSKIMNGNYDAK